MRLPTPFDKTGGLLFDAPYIRRKSSVKLKTLLSLNPRATYKFLKKRGRFLVSFYFSKWMGRTHWALNVEGLEIKLGWITAYQHAFAEGTSKSKNQNWDVLFALWKKQAESAKVIFDCGGFSGRMGLIAAKANPNADVVIFEPDHLNAQWIAHSIALNGLTNITVVESVISGIEGRVPFKTGISTGQMEEGGDTTVASHTLTSYGKKPDLINFDCIGGENAAIHEAKEYLSHTKVKMLVLMYPPSKDLPDFLSSLGYSLLYLYYRPDNRATYYFVS